MDNNAVITLTITPEELARAVRALTFQYFNDPDSVDNGNDQITFNNILIMILGIRNKDLLEEEKS